MRKRWHFSWLAVLALLLVGAVGQVHAEGTNENGREGDGENPDPKPDPDAGKDTYRYEFKVVDGVLIKMDRKTGAIEVVDPKKKVPNRAPNTIEPEKPKEKPKPSNKPPVIEELDSVPQAVPLDQEFLVPSKIAQVHRNAVREAVAGYASQLGLINLVQLNGDRLQGLISVSNRGSKRIEALEITLSAETTAGPVAFRFVLGYDPDHVQKPPQPPAKPDEKPASVFFKVDMPAPVGVMSKLDLQPTYIKFVAP